MLGEIFSRWSDHKAMRLGAALAYYGIFATAPVLIIIIAISGLFYGQAASESKVINAIALVAGSSTAQFVRGLVESASQPHQGVIAAIVGIAGIILGSTGLFFQLKDALNTIWEVAPKPGVHFWDTIRDNALSFAMVLGLGVLMLVALVLTAGVNTVESLLGSAVPVRHTVWNLLDYGLSLSMLTLLFAGIFKFLPDVHVHWRDVWVGAILTALLFSAAQWLLGVIIRLTHPGLAFGAAKAVIVILLWFNVVSLILLFGAEFICACTRRFGTPAKPKSYAKPVTHAAKALQGMPVNEQSAAISRQKNGSRV